MPLQTIHRAVNAAPTRNALAEITVQARQLSAKHRDLSFEKAYVEALTANPRAYIEYLAAKPGANTAYYNALLAQ